MSISYQIPHQARYIPTLTVAHASLVYGRYSFESGILNKGLEVLELKQNTAYLIERISISCNIAESIYHNTVFSPYGSLIEVPQIILKRQITNEIVYKTSNSLLNYINDSSVTAWVISDRSSNNANNPKVGDKLILDVNGGLIQNSELIGVTSIIMFIKFHIYAIESTIYNKFYRSGQGKNMGRSVQDGVASI